VKHSAAACTAAAAVAATTTAAHPPPLCSGADPHPPVRHLQRLPQPSQPPHQVQRLPLHLCRCCRRCKPGETPQLSSWRRIAFELQTSQAGFTAAMPYGQTSYAVWSWPLDTIQGLVVLRVDGKVLRWAAIAIRRACEQLPWSGCIGPQLSEHINITCQSTQLVQTVETVIKCNTSFLVTNVVYLFLVLKSSEY